MVDTGAGLDNRVPELPHGNSPHTCCMQGCMDGVAGMFLYDSIHGGTWNIRVRAAKGPEQSEMEQLAGFSKQKQARSGGFCVQWDPGVSHEGIAGW